MPIDDSLIARIRRSGYAGDAAQDSQKVEDYKVTHYTNEDVMRTHFENLAEEKLHRIADDSHQDHKAVTGQVPNEPKD
jgi:hypothetical protein